MKQKVDVIVDLQFGSTGKGLLAGVLALEHEYDVVITSNMPNAGHTFIAEDGTKYVHHVLGNGLVSPKIAYVMIGPGSVFDPVQLMKEWDHAALAGNTFEVVIHECAMVVSETHKIAETEMFGVGEVNSIGSTRQGSAAAMMEKIMRQPNAQIAREALRDTELYRYTCGDGDWCAILSSANKILVEGSQGYSLGISAGFYPFTTSRECTPGRILSDCYVPLAMVRHVYGTARVHPIRVAGTSGGGYHDQKEITWADIGVEPEFTTTTKRERRVFNFSQTQVRRAILQCSPNYIFLNFCNYDPDWSAEIESDVNGMLQWIMEGDSQVLYKGWGAKSNEVEKVEWKFKTD